jgi:ATP synthase F1 subcomplex alpha subunit
MKQVAGSLRLDLAQYRELAAFAQFGSDLDSSTQARINRGVRLVELLKQPQYQPMPVEEQVVSLFAATRGYLDNIPVADVRRFENEYLEFMRAGKSDILNDIKTKKEIDEDIEKRLRAAIDDFKKGFKSN